LSKSILIFSIFLSFTSGLVWITQPSATNLDWEVINQIKLEASPLDVATSTDGRWVFVLTQAEVLVYSTAEGHVINRIPVGENFDRLTHSSINNTLILGSGSGKTLKIIQLEVIHTIDISGLPFKGPEHAPVTIAVFGDYQ
jgi:hypothetical protein